MPKFDDLILSVSSFNPSLVMVTESWLTDSMISGLFEIPNFCFYRQDRRDRKGGGVCMWVSDRIRSSLHLLTHNPPSYCEFIFVNLKLDSHKIICCVIYIPPGLCKEQHREISDFIVSEIDHVHSSNPHLNIIIAGDFNDFPCASLEEALALKNKVNVATRMDSILDKIFVDTDLSDYFDEFAVPSQIRRGHRQQVSPLRCAAR